MTPMQCRMVRAGLMITTRELAALSGVSANTVVNFEKDRSVNTNSIKAIEQALLHTGKIKFESGGVIPQEATYKNQLLASIERGIADVNSGRTHSTQEAKKHLGMA